ncbi:MAG TPA: hypothetical protein VFD32_22300, partial [Dehalococcoidia bacterium]|nr:hypothetical protein [Dehalococcoidia bacterium]
DFAPPSFNGLALVQRANRLRFFGAGSTSPCAGERRRAVHLGYINIEIITQYLCMNTATIE